MSEFSGLRKTLLRRDREIHDLRTIVGALALWLELIDNGHASEHEAIENLREIVRGHEGRDYR